MKQAQMTGGAGIGTHDDEQTALIDSEAIQSALDALEDEACRAILTATRDESLTVKEIAERCDLPQSTAYRKINTLEEAGFLTESLRIRRSGSHASTYRCGIQDMTLSIETDGEIELRLEPTETTADAASLTL